jgi:hypothetical protein
MVSEFPFLLPRSVTVAQVILDHFVMVRIHARQLVLDEILTSHMGLGGKAACSLLARSIASKGPLARQ